jgi:hypothetical protein
MSQLLGIASAGAVWDNTDNVVFQHLLQKRRGGVPACDVVLRDNFEEALRYEPPTCPTHLLGFAAEIQSERRVSHQPALLCRKHRRYPRRRSLYRQQRLRLAADALFERGMNQDLVCGHCHGSSIVFTARWTQHQPRTWSGHGRKLALISHARIEKS